VGLSDYGPAGGFAAGHRHRLYARTILLEDAGGERIAFVTVDLGQPSFLLHREVANRLPAEVGIGADRLAIMATHTHAGPGHYFASRSYNEYAPGVRGYDPAVLGFLADRIALAIVDAADGLTPAVAGWEQEPVWGMTWNRSYEATQLNPLADNRPNPPPGLTPEERSIDPMWTMLRVDTITAGGDTVPAAAMSIFAFHPTGNPPANELYDGDVTALVERGLEYHIDALAGSDPPFAPSAVHLVANGAQGDAMLKGSSDFFCDRPAQRRGTRPAGPRTPAPLDEWVSESRKIGSECVSRARSFVNATGDSLASVATGIFDRAGAGLTSEVRISRAFRTIALAGADPPEGVCPEPEIGAGAAAGAEGSKSNLKDWRVLGFIPMYSEEGQVDRDRKDCQAPKRGLDWFLALMLGNLELPTGMQISVIQVGDMILALLPVEPTAEVGFRLREALLQVSQNLDLEARFASVVGLANGYMQYVATREEYQAQHYEGGSTLYGPGFAEFLQREIVALAGTLPAGGVGEVETLSGKPGAQRSIFPEVRGPEPEDLAITFRGCSSDTMIVRWFDVAPGRMLPFEGPIVILERSSPDEDTIRTWDDDRYVELRALENHGGRGYVWEVRWTPPGDIRGDYSITFPRRPGRTAVRSFQCQ
jgi:neutral ceramidase